MIRPIILLRAALIAITIIGLVIAFLFLLVDMSTNVSVGLVCLGSFISLLSGALLWNTRSFVRNS